MTRKLSAKGTRASVVAAAAVVLAGGTAAALGVGRAEAATAAVSKPVITSISDVTDSAITVNWKALPSGQTAEVQVYNATTMQSYAHLARLTGASKAITGLPAGTALYVRMVADSSSGNSGWSASQLAFTAASGGGTGPAGPAGPAGPGVLPYRSEVDNGAEFAVSTAGNLADTSAADATYSDAGIIVDDGPASSLSAGDFAFAASGGTVAENVWIGNAPQASVDGIYPLLSSDFCYGLGADYNDSGVPQQFQMQSKCGSYAGDTLTTAQVAADFPDQEAYTWAGVTSSGSAAGPVSFTALGGQTGLRATVGIGAASGVLTPYVTTPPAAS